MQALPPRLVNDALYVDGSRWWSLTCDQACCPAEGTPYDVTGHRLAAEAVFAGLTTRASREELAATVAGPPPAEVPRLVELAAEVRTARTEWPAGEDPAVRLLGSVQAGLADPGALDDRACAELAVAGGRYPAPRPGLGHDRPGERGGSTSHSGSGWSAGWTRRCRPRRWPWSAWPAGSAADGALLNCAGEQLSRRHPSYSMGHLLEQISARAIPPRLWQSMGGEVHADLRRELARLAG